MLHQLTAIVSSIAVTACSVVGIRETPEPKYTIVGRIGDTVEVREYGPRIAAETVVAASEMQARNEGFRRLAGYIFGGNTTQAKIEMTAPVTQAPASGGTNIAMTAPVAQERTDKGEWRIRFFMPPDYTMATLPKPDNAAVTLQELPPETFAVLRFSGARDAEAIQGRQTELISAVAASRWQQHGDPVAWFYDPPWTIPALRRNEVAVPVIAR